MYNELYFQSIKKSMRIFSNEFDDEIKSLIDESIDYIYTFADVDINHSLIKKAIRTYVKAEFGNNENRDKLLSSFQEICIDIKSKENTLGTDFYG